jgi:single-strand DNA-binding protein
MNNVVLIGRLTKDPELRYIASGTPVSTFTLAVDKNLSSDKKQEMESRNQPTADFIRIVVWDKMGENCANYLEKGRKVGIQGRIQSGSYDDNGTRRYTTDVVATNVEFLDYKDTSNNSDDTSFYDISGFTPVDNGDIPF